MAVLASDWRVFSGLFGSLLGESLTRMAGSRPLSQAARHAMTAAAHTPVLCRLLREQQ
jgi:hypothetical protein